MDFDLKLGDLRAVAKNNYLKRIFKDNFSNIGKTIIHIFGDNYLFHTPVKSAPVFCEPSTRQAGAGTRRAAFRLVVRKVGAALRPVARSRRPSDGAAADRRYLPVHVTMISRRPVSLNLPSLRLNLALSPIQSRNENKELAMAKRNRTYEGPHESSTKN